MFTMKKRSTDNECVADFLDMYCEGKSFIWRWFFGFRKFRFISDTQAEWIFIVPKRIWELAKSLAYKYDEYEIL